MSDLPRQSSVDGVSRQSNADVPRQSNFDVVPKRKQAPLFLSIFVGRHSHFLPAILCIAYLFAEVSGHVPGNLLPFACLGIVLAWLVLRFGYQLWITRLINTHNYQNAVNSCLILMKLFPDDSYLLVNAADAYYGLDEYLEAIELANEAIQFGQRLPLAYLIRTKALVGIQRAEDAKQTDLIESTSPPKETSDEFQLMLEDFRVRKGKLGVLLKRKDDNYRVLEEMERFFRSPNLAAPFLYISLAYYLARLGHVDLAQEELDKAAGSNKRNAQAYWLSNQARIHLLRGNAQAALEASTRAAELFQEYDILATHGLMLLRNNRLKDAKKTLNEAIESADELKHIAAEAHYFRAELFEKTGDKESAEDERKFALKNGYIPYL